MLQKAKFRCLNSELTGIKKIWKNSQVFLDFNIFKVRSFKQGKNKQSEGTDKMSGKDIFKGVLKIFKS